MRLCWFVPFLVVLTGCSGRHTTAPTQPFDLRLTIPQGQTLGVEGTGVSVRFDQVSEDSRCPLNAMCVTAGRAVVRLTVIVDGTASPVELRSDPASARLVTAHGVRVEWEQLQPYPVAPPRVPDDGYQLTVRLAR